MSKDKINRSRGGSKIPKGVVNKAAYKRFKKLRDSDIFKKENTIISTSDLSLTVDLNSRRDHLEKKIEYLTDEERAIIIKKKEALDSARGKLSVEQKRAYGSDLGRGNNKGSILDPMEPELLEMFGSYHTVPEVYEVVTKSWGYDIHIQTLHAFFKRHSDDIKVKRDDYKRNYQHVRLVHKRARLDELTYLYNDRKKIYEDTRKHSDYQLLMQTIEQIRSESEGNKFDINIKGAIDVQHQIDVQIKYEVLRKLSVMEIIVSRVATRLGVNPVYIMNRLQRSIYAKFSGLKRPDGELMDQEPIYPSSHIYEFDKIKKESKEHIQEAKELRVIPEVSEEDESAGEAVKMALEAAILKKKQELKEKDK